MGPRDTVGGGGCEKNIGYKTSVERPRRCGGNGSQGKSCDLSLTCSCILQCSYNSHAYVFEFHDHSDGQNIKLLKPFNMIMTSSSVYKSLLLLNSGFPYPLWPCCVLQRFILKKKVVKKPLSVLFLVTTSSLSVPYSVKLMCYFLFLTPKQVESSIKAMNPCNQGGW